METLRKIRESVAKQQQGLKKTFSANAGPQHSETIIIDEAELERHQQLERLYATTKAGKHFQREIIRGVEGILFTGTKQAEHSQALADACRKYGTEGPNVYGALGKASLHCSNARMAVEKERDMLHRNLSAQVGEPLKAMVNGAPLDDARMLTQRYDRLRQEADQQSSAVYRFSQKAKDGTGNPETAQRLQMAEQKMGELASAMAVLGKEAASSMSAVDAQQQRLTLQRLIAMVEAERSFHQRSAEILDHLLTQMVTERQRSESMPPPSAPDQTPNPFSSPPPSYEEANGAQTKSSKNGHYYLAEVMHPFYAELEGELSLTPGDYVVVRQVAPTGWAEGELKGKAGWFPAAYVERRHRVPASKLVEPGN